MATKIIYTCPNCQWSGIKDEAIGTSEKDRPYLCPDCGGAVRPEYAAPPGEDIGEVEP